MSNSEETDFKDIFGMSKQDMHKFFDNIRNYNFDNNLRDNNSYINNLRVNIKKNFEPSLDETKFIKNDGSIDDDKIKIFTDLIDYIFGPYKPFVEEHNSLMEQMTGDNEDQQVKKILDKYEDNRDEIKNIKYQLIKADTILYILRKPIRLKLGAAYQEVEKLKQNIEELEQKITKAPERKYILFGFGKKTKDEVTKTKDEVTNEKKKIDDIIEINKKKLVNLKDLNFDYYYKIYNAAYAAHLTETNNVRKGGKTKRKRSNKKKRKSRRRKR